MNPFEAWTLHAAGGLEHVPAALLAALERGVPASVPGCVHTDLLAAGLIPDLYLGTNETLVAWIGHVDWRYRCTFRVDERVLEHDRLELVCEGLDTVATLRLNGRVVGQAENMHHAHRFAVDCALRPGENSLEVVFTSAVRYAREMCERLGDLPRVNRPEPFNFIRKMACNFGWDWGPSLVTAGIHRPIYLQAWDVARVASVRPLVRRADEQRAVLEVHVALEHAAKSPASLERRAELVGPTGESLAQTASVAGDAALLRFEVPEPQLWSPRGYGAQPLYDLSLTLSAGSRTLTGRAPASAPCGSTPVPTRRARASPSR